MRPGEAVPDDLKPAEALGIPHWLLGRSAFEFFRLARFVCDATLSELHVDIRNAMPRAQYEELARDGALDDYPRIKQLGEHPEVARGAKAKSQGMPSLPPGLAGPTQVGGDSENL